MPHSDGVNMLITTLQLMTRSVGLGVSRMGRFLSAEGRQSFT